MGQYLHTDTYFLDREVSGFCQNQHSGRETGTAKSDHIDRLYLCAIDVSHAAQMLLLWETARGDCNRVRFNFRAGEGRDAVQYTSKFKATRTGKQTAQSRL